MTQKENQMGSQIKRTDDKAQYFTPRLATYGDIRELTLTKGIMGAIDTKTAIPTNKTS